MTGARVDEELVALAAAHGVATSYRDAQRRPVQVDAEVVVRVLGLLGVPAGTSAERRQELSAVTSRSGRLPATLALRTGQGRRLPGPAVLTDAAGQVRELPDGLPQDLPLGWYQLDLAGQQVTLVVAPPRLPDPPPAWGWMLQLYALRSAASWGIGDLGDLIDFVEWTAREHGAGTVLLNPLHAITPVHPVQRSPYTPSSRQFVNPLYLRPERTAAYARADPATRAEVDALRVDATADRIDHDRVWAAKRSGLELLWRAEGRPQPPMPEGLAGFATFCALAERHGANWPDWPAGLRHPSSPAAVAASADLAPRVAFHAWVQQQADEQLEAVRDSARAGGMGIGVIHDLAVGVDPRGADAWALQDVLALGVTVGAPPDPFSQQGQDWGLPPWRPDLLAATGHRAYRELVQAALAHADGLRIDHVAGLWRLWWVPPGESPDRGTYVHYDSDVMLAVLALEAHRAGAVVIGEDLGTVEPEVTAALHEQRILGSSVLWFARQTDAPGMLPARQWPARAAASISTHDLPTAAGFLRGEHVRVRAELGLLDDVPAETARAETQLAELLALLRTEGLLGAQPTEQDVIVAMHALLAATPCRLVLVSLYDVLAEPRQPNLPGTIEEYPNWRLPLPVTLEALRNDPRIAEIVAVQRSG